MPTTSAAEATQRLPPPSHLHPPPLTAADIVLLAKTPSAALPSSASHSALLSLLHSPFLSPVTATTYLSSLLSLISHTPPSPSLPSLLSSLLLAFLRLLRSHEIPRDKEASHLLQLFSFHLPSIDRSQLPAVLDLLVSDLEGVVDPDDALHLDLLPRCLDLAVEDGGEGAAAPVLERILAADWSKAVLVKMVSILREFPVHARPRAAEFLEKAFGRMDGVDVQDLPSLVYQLLLLASKGFSRRAVIRGVLGFFGGRSIKGPPAVIRQVEGTVLMHVNFAVKQDPSLGQEVIGVLRSDIGVFNHFAVLVLMSVARVRRFNESTIGLLRSIVVTAYKDYKFARNCKWLPDSMKDECLDNVKCVEKSLIRAVNESNSGREHILPSIVHVGFMLLESVDSEPCRGLSASEHFVGIEDLSIRMLTTLFEVHDMARNEIIEQCKYRILALKPQQSIAIVKFLGYLIQHYPYPMLDYIARLKELLDYFSFMSDKIALAIITSILPLIKFARDLQDYIILVLRKALFRREDTIRIAAANAIINLILVESKSRRNGSLPLQESSSQASSSQQPGTPCRMELGLFQELNGLLRRCLSQQARIKEIMYQGLLKLVVIDPFASSAVFDFLWPHFLQFYKEDQGFPLEIHDCSKLINDRVSFEEPLDCLLSCASWILLLQPDSEVKADHSSEFSRACLGFSLSQETEALKTSPRELFSNALLKIRKSLRSISLEDMLGLIEEPTSRPLQGEKANYCLCLLSGIVEVVVNTAAAQLEKAADAEKEDLEIEIMELVDLHESLEKQFHSNKRHNARRGSIKTQEIPDNLDNDSKEFSVVKLVETRNCLLATSCIHQLLLTALRIYNSSNPSGKLVSQNTSQSSSCSTYERCCKLISFSLKAFHRHAKSLCLVGSDDSLKSLINEDINLLAVPLFQLLWSLKSECISEMKEKKKESKGKKSVIYAEELICLSLTCMNDLFKACSDKRHFLDLIERLVSSDTENGVVPDDDVYEQDFDVSMQEEMNANSFLVKKIRPMYSTFVGLSLFQEYEILSDVILAIGDKLAHKIRDSHGVWAENLCRSMAVENSRSARRIAGLAICLRSPPNDLAVAQLMASELLKVVGSESMDPVKKSETCPIINDSTSLGIASEVLQFIEVVIADLDWALSKLKALTIRNPENMVSRKSYKSGENSLELQLEEAFYSRSEALANLLSYFAEMNLKDSQAEQFLKLTAKFYKLLAQIAKLQIAPKGCKQVFPAQTFRKLVEVTCKMLTAPLYNFVALVQRNQQEGLQTKGIISKIKRENRCIPDLIYHIEDYEKYLIQLSKLTKVNFLRYAKRSTARDFKILQPKKDYVPEEVPEQEPNDGDSEASQSDSDQDCEGQEEENGSDEEVLPDVRDNGGSAAEDSEPDEDVRVERAKRIKRAKMSKVVQDSDED